jgi:hypothetical protein
MDKFQPLRDARTNGVNYDLDTDDVISHLQDWDAKYGIELSGVETDAVVVGFKRLPEDAMTLAKDIAEFCPDTIDQHFGCVHEMLEAAEEMGEEAPEHIRELVKGVDLEDENYGLELLKRSLEKNKMVALWWD